MHNVAEKIKRILVESRGIDATAIKAETHLSNDLHIDSLDMIELVMQVEREFNLHIPDERVSHFRKVKDVINYIEQAVSTRTLSNSKVCV